MLRLPPGLIGRDVDLGERRVTPADVLHYAQAIGDDDLVRAGDAAGRGELPLGFALALRGGPLPAVELAAGTVSVHAGHTITVHRPLALPGAYRIRARIADVFEKSGRTGPLTVIVRRAEIADDAGVGVAIDEQQIARWRPPQTSVRPLEAPRLAPAGEPWTAAPLVTEVPEIGAQIGSFELAAPSPAAVDRYAGGLSGREPLFVDPAVAHALGYADVIVPGPMLSAMLERMLRGALPAWQLRRLGLSFRVSVVAGEAVTLAAVVVEHHVRPDGEWLTCDLWIEIGASERAVTGTAELRRR